MRRNSYVLSLILCIAMALSGCKEKPVASKYDDINTAIGYFNEGLDYDKAGQMRLAELFYKRAYDLLIDDPSYWIRQKARISFLPHSKLVCSP